MKLRIVQCKCADICCAQPFQFRHWSVKRPDGSIYLTAHTWDFALEVALDYSTGYTKAQRRLIRSATYGKKS